MTKLSYGFARSATVFFATIFLTLSFVAMLYGGLGAMPESFITFYTAAFYMMLASVVYSIALIVINARRVVKSKKP